MFTQRNPEVRIIWIAQEIALHKSILTKYTATGSSQSRCIESDAFDLSAHVEQQFDDVRLVCVIDWTKIIVWILYSFNDVSHSVYEEEVVNISADMFADSGSSLDVDPYHLSQSGGAVNALSISDVCFL